MRMGLILLLSPNLSPHPAGAVNPCARWQNRAPPLQPVPAPLRNNKRVTLMKKLIAPALVALSLTAPAHAMDLTELTDAERAQFRAEVRAYLMENPEVIMEAVNQLQARQAEAQAQADFTLVSDNAAAILRRASQDAAAKRTPPGAVWFFNRSLTPSNMSLFVQLF